MFSFVHCNRCSLRCLLHQNVGIACEWKALSIGTSQDPTPACTILFVFVHIHIFTFSSNATRRTGLKNKHRLFNKLITKLEANRIQKMIEARPIKICIRVSDR